MDLYALPKVALHDHLDGGVRPATLLELAKAEGVALPAESAQALAQHIAARANRGSLVGYLEAFSWTLPVMQSAQALARIAREAVEDLASDGVVLAELRFAPLLHLQQGLSAEQAISAVAEGLRQGSAATGVPAGLILCALRCNDEFDEVARLFDATHADGVVVGVDLAGPEAGFPVSRHPGIARFAASRPGAPITLHAGEAAGVESMWEAVEAGARRIGHGTRLIDDILADRALLRAIQERDILLEVCLRSNHQTGAIPTLEAHPLRRFLEEGVKVTLEADNRLMSATRHSAEYQLARELFRVSNADMRAMTRHGLEASFLPAAVKAEVAARYAKVLRQEPDTSAY
jgi:adenosine deaminase